MIVRGSDAKPFVKMRQPYFQIKDHLRRHGVAAFSSNGDMSERVMTIIESMVPALEVYSIDEAFADLTGIPGDLTAFGCEIRAAIYKRTGIARAKTLAKLANHNAKHLLDETGGVVDICDPFKRDWTIRNTDVGEVWGVCRRMKAHLKAMGIKSAMDLGQADAWTLLQEFGVVMEKTARELAGTPSLELSEVDPPKHEICCSRMFGMRLTEIQPIKEAVATYTQNAAEKRRAQGSLCKKIRVSIRAGMFNPEEAKHANRALVELPYPTNYVRLMTKAATEAVNWLFRDGFKYSNAEVLLMDLRQPGEFTSDLFAQFQPIEDEKVIRVLYEKKWGRGTLRPASVPLLPIWRMRQAMKSVSHTTRLDQLWVIKTN